MKTYKKTNEITKDSKNQLINSKEDKDYKIKKINFSHEFIFHNRKLLLNSKTCGCVYCFEVFLPKVIVHWIDQGTTAICPYCGVDAVIGEVSVNPITREVLMEISSWWFQ